MKTGGEEVHVHVQQMLKLRVPAIGGIPLRAVGVDLHFLAGETALTAALAAEARQLFSQTTLPSNGSVFAVGSE